MHICMLKTDWYSVCPNLSSCSSQNAHTGHEQHGQRKSWTSAPMVSIGASPIPWLLDSVLEMPTTSNSSQFSGCISQLFTDPPSYAADNLLTFNLWVYQVLTVPGVMSYSVPQIFRCFQGWWRPLLIAQEGSLILCQQRCPWLTRQL